MPEAISIELPIDETVHAGAYLYLFIGPTQAAFENEPAVSGRIQCRPASATHPEWLQSRWLEGRWLEGVGSGGWLDGKFLNHAFLGHEDLVRWTGGHFYGPVGLDGTLGIIAKIYDKDDRVSASSPSQIDVTINTSPRPAVDLLATSKSSDQITFTFTPSPGIVANDGTAR